MRKGLMRLAALVMLAIAGLHMVSLMLAGPLAEGLAGALPAVAAVAVAAGLWRGWRWVAWLAMLGAIVGLPRGDGARCFRGVAAAAARAQLGRSRSAVGGGCRGRRPVALSRLARGASILQVRRRIFQVRLLLRSVSLPWCEITMKSGLRLHDRRSHRVRHRAPECAVARLL